LRRLDSARILVIAFLCGRGLESLRLAILESPPPVDCSPPRPLIAAAAALHVADMELDVAGATKLQIF
jgi:hypothetical protein